MKRVAFYTIGCKLNQFETEQMREAAEAGGYGTSDDAAQAEVCVINTCTVTSKSDYRSRQAVRRALRGNPGALVVVTGCYAQRKPDELASIAGVDIVLGNVEKDSIAAYLGLPKQASPVVRVTPTDQMDRLAGQRELHGFGSYTRAFVKIQDGCDNCCTYCAVPSARGRGRSKRPIEVRRELQILASRGYKEIVLTGVHLGSYGRDLVPPTSLAALLREIAATEGAARFRLSSIEPTDFSDDLIDLLADASSRICPHVHVPLQSGDDRILKMMGRPYGRAGYRRLVERIAGACANCGIGADVMVGFPGEDHQAFQNTLSLLRDLPITYLHVFAFSRREGTVAAGFGPETNPGEKKERSRALRALGTQKSQAFRESLVGRVLETLILGATPGSISRGLSGNYVKVFFASELAPNTMVSALVTGSGAGGVEAIAQGSSGRGVG
ncbi:MAG TPA: tRNA (N(6)-L-threonylcarbamoyladenosine(37)-C(2))-methylthiotransferase MtaB [bacterium]|nr:tRNA (N(6)-L-threonylcarbamoyladenosine(37)-C(2))-methylthiotransferase MtaB [bacterium]